MSKRAALSLLRRLAFAHTLVGDSYKARAYTSAVWPLSKVDGDLGELHASGELRKVRGIGRGVEDVVAMALAGEEPPVLAELEAQIPDGVFQLARLPGLGPAKVKLLWQELGVSTISELEYAIQENRLLSLKGFGAKTQAKILVELERRKAEADLFRRDQAMAAAEAILPDLTRPTIAGDLRRGCEVVDRLVVVCLDDPVRLATLFDGELEGDVVRLLHDSVPVELHGTTEDRYGTTLVRQTGSEAYLDALGELTDAPTEEAVYAALGLLPIAPERREAGAPRFAIGQARPRLVRRDDLRGALHNHTTASDGADSLEAMRDAAAALGLTYLGITEHSQAAHYAGGLSPEALHAQTTQIHRQPEHPCTILAGIESDILEHGDLDYDGALLEALDFVIASVHRRHRQDGEAMTARMLKAVDHPATDIIGHPTGRLLLGRAPTKVDMAALLDRCAATGTAIELNASPHRLDLSVEHLAMAKERGVLVSIGADAHSTAALNNLDHGIAIARRAGLTAEDVLNTRSLPELRTWLQERRA